MLAVLVNFILVGILGFLGSKIGDKFSESLRNSIMNFLAAAIIVIGIRSSMKGDILVIIISVVIGLIIGEFLGLDSKLNKLSSNIEKKYIKDTNSNFSESFLNASILFCFGAMGIIGCIEAGVTGDDQVLMGKALIDGVVAFFMAQSMGIGVSFSSFSILIFQALLVLLAGFLSPYLGEDVINNISGTGGLTIIVIGLSQLKLVDSKIANILPALAIPVIYGLISGLI